MRFFARFRLRFVLPLAGVLLSAGLSAQAADQFKVFNPPLTITTAKAVTDDKSYITGEDPQNNAMYRLFESAIGLKFVNKFSAPSQGYVEKIKLGIASNDIPDFFWVSVAEFNLLSKNNMIENLTPFIEKYASANTKKTLNFNGGLALKAVTKDNKLFALPQYTDGLNGVNLVYIRTDWLKKLGLQPPKNYDEMIAIARAFTNKDPDGNGKKDTYGFAVGKDRSGLFEGFYNAFGAYPNANVVKKGQLAPGAIQPETRLVLEKLAGYYKEGLFDPEFAVRDLGKVAETVAQGKAGMIFGEFYWPLWPLWDNFRNDAKAEWVGYKIRDTKGAEIVPFVPLNVGGYYVVRKGFSNPEAIVIMMNHYVEQIYGNYAGAFAKGWDNIANTDTTTRDRAPHNWSPFFSDSPTANWDRSVAFAKARETGKSDFLDQGKLNQWNNQVKPGLDGDANNWGWSRVYFNGVPEAGSYAKTLSDQYFGPPTPSSIRYGANLQKSQEETFLQIISNTKPITAFDTFVTQYLAQGGKTHIAEMNAAQK